MDNLNNLINSDNPPPSLEEATEAAKDIANEVFDRLFLVNIFLTITQDGQGAYNVGKAMINLVKAFPHLDPEGGMPELPSAEDFTRAGGMLSKILNN